MQAAPKGLAFGAMAAAGQCAYLVGGRLRKGIAPGRRDRDRSSLNNSAQNQLDFNHHLQINTSNQKVCIKVFVTIIIVN